MLEFLNGTFFDGTFFDAVRAIWSCGETCWCVYVWFIGTCQL